MNYAKITSNSKKNTRNDQSQEKKTEDKKSAEEKNLAKFLKNISNNRNSYRRPETNFQRPKPFLPTIQQKFAAPRGDFNVPVLSRQLNYLKIKEPTLEEKKKELQLCLSKSESPFIWRPKQGKPVDGPGIATARLQKKDKETRDVNTFKWRNFILQLVISYELFKEKKISKALEKLEELKNNLALKKHSTSESWLFDSVEGASWHVINASKAYLLLESNLIDEGYKLIHEIQPVETMKQAHKAGIHGIKAAVFMEYGHRGNVKGLAEAVEAEKLDRTNGEWHFLIGKCMGRIRRVSKCYELVDPLEVRAFNKAADLDKINAYYKVYLAQAIREKAFREFKNKKEKLSMESYKKMCNAYTASCYKYKEARDRQPNCPHLLTRCAFGMMKMPEHLVDLKFIRECIDKALELAPENPMANHVKAMYHERFLVDAEIPLGAYEKAATLGNFGAAMDLVRMHYKLKQENIDEKLERIAEQFDEPCKKEVAYMQAGSYLLFIKKDIVGAVKFYQKVINIDSESYAMKYHKPLFFPLENPVNMFNVIWEELEKNTEMKNFSPEEQKILKTFLIANRRLKLNSSAEQEILNVEKILDMSRCYCKRMASRSRKRKRCIQKPKKPKKWCGKPQKEGGEKGKDQRDSPEKSKNAQPMGETKERNNIRKDSARGSHFQQQKSSFRERTSSVSSVDSDYCRDSRVLGKRDLFSSHCKNMLSQSDQIDQESFVSSSAAKYTFSRSRINSTCSSRSRDSSICSISSNEALNESRYHPQYFQEDSAEKTNNKGDKKLGLTVENLKRFDSNHTNDLGRRLSVMSISSAGSENELGVTVENLDRFYSKDSNELEKRLRKMSISSTESDQSKTKRIMEKVKQSYGMLGYKNSNESMHKNSQKNGSSQSLNNQKSNKKGTSFIKPNFQRSESTQSLNIQHTNHKPLSQESYNPANRSRNSSVESTRSSLFMPSFASKKSEGDRENL